MARKIEINAEWRQALELLDAGRSVFLTGKAGTGKSTLLRYFLDRTDRRVVAVAPTGVAALNIGGTTIHRFFSFPATVTPEMVAGDYFPGRSHKTIRDLQTLVIDEVSMARADLVDCVEIALRRFGPKRGEPFGGVQVVLIGDPYQLPPVVTDNETEHFQTRYSNPFFFAADAFKSFDYDLIELKKVYRQEDPTFLEILNAIRTGEADQGIFDRLNERYNPEFDPPTDEFWVTLTTTNSMADRVNRRKLDALENELHVSLASIWGEVAPNDMPTEVELEFKVGAQIMLITNDPSDRWVNGSMGAIVDVRGSDTHPVVAVKLLDSGEIIEVEKHDWEITVPRSEGGRLTYEVIGRFTQLPFRLAWAVTIHKSQGKTLERVVVDLGRGTFADGQLYVALSRATSLEGLVTRSLVKSRHVKVEREVTRFLKRGEASVSLADAKETAFLAVVATGVDKFARILEVAVLIRHRDGSEEAFSTLINPLRDVGSVAEHGIPASRVTYAPSFKEAWPFFARRLQGCAVVGHGLAAIQKLIEREVSEDWSMVDLGLGYDTQRDFPAPLAQALIASKARKRDLPLLSAMDRAVATSELFEKCDLSGVNVQPYEPGLEAQRPARLYSRSELTGAWRNASDSRLEFLDHLAIEFAQDEESPKPDDIARLLAASGLSDEEQRSAIDAFGELVTTAIARDGAISSAEQQLLDKVRSLRGTLAEIEVSTVDADLEQLLRPGSEVCFTGEYLDPSGLKTPRSELEAIAKRVGLTVRKSVTKKLALVLAADPTSMSGKSKDARSAGVPIASVDDFLNWVHSKGN